MSSQSLDRWLLVNYAGYPFAANSLFPDNGLANLAGVLIGAGKSVEILDYATVTTLDRFSSPALTRRLLRTWQSTFAPGDKPVRPAAKLRALVNLRYADFCRSRRQACVLGEIEEDILRTIRHRDIQAVGFKLWNGDGWEGSAEIAARIRRECLNVRIFGGGPQVDFFLGRILQARPAFDALVCGEGEETILLLAETGADPSSYGTIPNLLFARDGQIMQTETRMVADLDALPMPVYDAETYPAMRGDEKIRILVIDESRGCRNNCAFCIHPVKSNRNLRMKSTDKLLAEIANMRDRHGIHAFRFAGSCTPYDLLNRFANEVLARNLDVTYSSFAHVRESESADFRAMRRSGCVALFFGVESGSQEVLDLMGKGVTMEQTERAFANAKAAGVFSVASLIVPAPGDTAETQEETLAALRRMQPDGVSIQPPGVFPRTPWFNHPERYGISLPDPDAYVREILGWKIRVLLPTSFWSDLPVRIDGRRFKSVLGATAEFSRRVAALGLVTSVSDDSVLMSACAKMDVREFRDESRLAFLTGDASRVRHLVEKINAGT